MKAVVFKGVGNIVLDDVAEPVIQDQKDAIVKITVTTICGTDLHAVRGTMAGMKKGTILGHEGVGVIEQIGSEVRSFKVGDRVIIPSTVFCGFCGFCKRELYSQCDNANPHGADSGTAFYGGPESSGPFNGLQAEKARVPFADVSLIKIPDNITNEQVILLSDILPTAYQAVEYIEPEKTDKVAVFGCGPVGQLVIACLKQRGIKDIFAIDRVQSRLEFAASQGAAVINFDKEDPVAKLKNLTNGKGPDKVIDAVGIDAEKSHCCSLTYFKTPFTADHFKEELKEIAPEINPKGTLWVPGNAPSQVFQWAIQSLAKAGTFSIIGVYTELMRFFPVGEVMQKNLTVRAGNCNHRRYMPMLLEWVEKGTFDPMKFISKKVDFINIIDAYEHFDRRENGWLKVLVKV